ncbi:unnamed protein product [Staurois parvus]|uniref:Uncharacterized protein n=1 Tax=Staurois parvus TaxID=386267 RepID=A0ABN9FR11_9NEOB|nr:unnamed protein product [Staurois parvus]
MFSESSDKLFKFWTVNSCRTEKTADKQVQHIEEDLFSLCVSPEASHFIS